MVATLAGTGDKTGRDLRRYAAAIHPIAEAEYGTIDEYELLEEAIEATAAYPLLIEPVLLALRRLAHEDVSSRLHNKDGDQ